MKVPKEEKRYFCLFFYTEKVWVSEKVCVSSDEEIWIHIDEARLHTGKPLKFIIRWSDGIWNIPEAEAGRGNFFLLKTEAEEKVYVVVEEEKNALIPCERMGIEEGASVTLGTEFVNDVFYEYEMEAKGTAFCIWKENEHIWLEERGKESKKRMRIYVNGNAVTGKMKMEPGDYVLFWGLEILVLPAILLCTAHYGNMRMAKKWEVPSGQDREKREIRIDKEKKTEMLFTEVKNIREEEVEIEAPQAEEKQMQQPFLLAIGPTISMMLPVLCMSMAYGTMAGNGYYQTTIFMTVLSVLLSSFWAIMNYCYRKYNGWHTERKRQNNYRQYLRQTEKYLQQCKEENRIAMHSMYPSATEVIEAEMTGNGKYKERSNERGWFIRLGLGTIPFQIKIKLPGRKKELCRDYLLREAYEMAEGYCLLEQVPIGVDLKNIGSIGYVADYVCPPVMQIIVQLIAGHSSSEMKLIFFYHEKHRQEQQMAQCLKWLPHVWADGKQLRFLAGNEQEAGEIIPYITDRLKNKQEMGIQYIFVIADWQLVKGESIAGFLTKGKEYGVRTIFMLTEQEQFLNKCNCMIWKKEGIIRWYEENKITEQKMCLEECENRFAENYIRHLAGTEEKVACSSIPDKVSFLDLYGCNRVEELNCSFRWKESHTRDRMRVPIGKEMGTKTVYLDIHEKFHGPHGLVAGTTGAGKSELLQTYLLSLAVSFSPEDINFFIIDYKGGGMGESLSELPHCSGVVSNLSGAQIRRALTAIKSENIRRQEYLRNAGESHIEGYRTLYAEGKVKTPMPHLIIVVDEFAELKREEPEFMQEVISLSQVGRSLGVHLILATQKPAGCVDERIWSNTRFRLCLRVAEKQDSMDMLHRSEAVELQGMGRGYLQVGNNEIFTEFQAGYSKEKYQTSREGADTVLVSNTGRRLQLAGKRQDKEPTQIEMVIDYVNRISKRNDYAKVQRLWMPELPEIMYLPWKGEEQRKKIYLGIQDDVLKREQNPIGYEAVKDGHLCLCGGPATGKSTFLQTLLWQLCKQNNCNEAQILLAASDYAGVNCFTQMPHCLGYLRKEEEAECFFYHLENLVNHRKNLLEGISYAQYQKRKSEKIPQIFLVIDNYGKFRQMTEDKYAPLIEKLACEGLSLGIYLWITAHGIGGSEVPVKLFEKVKTTLALELSDMVAYGDILRRYHIHTTPAEGRKGRGLCRCKERILEFQVPLIGKGDDYERISMIEEECAEQSAKGMEIKKFPSIPDKGDFKKLWNDFEKKKEISEMIPLGYSVKSGEVRCIEIGKFPFVITGGAKSGKKNLFEVLLKGCYRQGMTVLLYDIREEMQKEEVNFAIFVSSEEIRKADFPEGKDIVLGICNLWDFIREIPYTESMPPILAVSKREEEVHCQGSIWYEKIRNHQRGICLGGNPGNQRMLQFSSLSYEEMNKQKPPGYGYLKQGTEEERIRLIPYKREV